MYSAIIVLSHTKLSLICFYAATWSTGNDFVLCLTTYLSSSASFVHIVDILRGKLKLVTDKWIV